MKFLRTAALIAALTASVVGTADVSAQSQTSDQSGAMTLQFTIAKYVEFISHAPSTHNLGTELRPGALVAVPDGMVMREFRANTPFSLSVTGITSDGQMAFVNAAGEQVMLDVACSTWDTSTVQSDLAHEDWDCNGGSLHVGRTTGWASLRLSLSSVPYGLSAGEYSGVVFFDIEAM